MFDWEEPWHPTAKSYLKKEYEFPKNPYHEQTWYQKGSLEDYDEVIRRAEIDYKNANKWKMYNVAKQIRKYIEQVKRVRVNAFCDCDMISTTYPLGGKDVLLWEEGHVCTDICQTGKGQSRILKRKDIRAEKLL